MNVQVAAWPLWAANHDEEFISMLRLLEENLNSIREAVPPEYQDECGAMICEYVLNDSLHYDCCDCYDCYHLTDYYSNTHSIIHG